MASKRVEVGYGASTGVEKAKEEKTVGGERFGASTGGAAPFYEFEVETSPFDEFGVEVVDGASPASVN